MNWLAALPPSLAVVDRFVLHFGSTRMKRKDLDSVYQDSGFDTLVGAS